MLTFQLFVGAWKKLQRISHTAKESFRLKVDTPNFLPPA